MTEISSKVLSAEYTTRWHLEGRFGRTWLLNGEYDDQNDALGAIDLVRSLDPDGEFRLVEVEVKTRVVETRTVLDA